MADQVDIPNSKNDDVVIDVAKTSLSDLWKLEDYWAIWLGLIILIIGLFIFIPNPPKGMNNDIAKYNTLMKEEEEQVPFKTIAWHKASKDKSKIQALNESYAKKIKGIFDKPKSWKFNPLDSLFLSKQASEIKNEKAKANYQKAANEAETMLNKAKASQEAAALAEYKDESLNDKAKTDVNSWLQADSNLSKAKKKVSNKPYNLIPSLFLLGLILIVLFGFGLCVMGNPPIPFFKGFIFVFFISILSYLIGEQQTNDNLGLGYPLWAILIGMLISNTIGLPKWVEPAIQTEFYIKTGLVLLGAEVLFGKMLSIGIPGIFVAWGVTPVVIVFSFWFGDKILKIPSKTLNITTSAALSVCGVSAAIATASACRAKKEELTLAIGISLGFTVAMMVSMPAFIKAIGMDYIVGGAWMGGTIDSTGAVAAAGEFLSEKAMYVAATIKMIQNIMIGVVAFFVALYWCTKIDCQPGQKVSPMEIWYRFPKFILGFVGTSIIFSILFEIIGVDVSNVLIENGVIKGLSKLIREWMFCLAFTSIGLASNFKELKKYLKGGKLLTLYILGQSFNLILTLAFAYLMFSILFPGISAKI
ncbi:YeiH family protein [bacterium]|nr:YeiH family protein [bacterium]